MAVGAITVELESKPVPSFDEYMFGLRPGTNTRNPWFRDYWQRLHDCIARDDNNDTGGGRICSKDTSMRNSPNYEQGRNSKMSGKRHRT